MFALFWVILLFADTDASPERNCEKKPCVVLSEADLTAQTGLCLVVPCSFEANSEPENIIWLKSNGTAFKTIFSLKKHRNGTGDFEGRVLLLGKDVKKKNCSIVIRNLTAADSGAYRVEVFWGKNESTSNNTNISVTERTEKPTLDIPPLIAGQEAELKCSTRPLCPPFEPQFSWTWSGAGQEGNVSTGRHRSTLTFNVSAEHHNANISCAVGFGGGAAMEETKTLRLSSAPKILATSRCELHADVLTCVCISEGSPSPRITWPQLENRTAFSVTTNVSERTVSSSATVSVRGPRHPAVECVSDNGVSEERRRLNITNVALQPEDVLTALLRTVQRLDVIISFSVGLLLGIVVASVVACLIRKCRRKKHKTGDVTEELEMVSCRQEDADQEVTDEGTPERRATEGGDELLAKQSNWSPKEVEYSDIDFSTVKRKETAEEREAADTEYAEIKRDATEEEGRNDGEEDGAMEGEEEEGMVGKDEGMNECVTAKEDGGEELALYSNVEEVMSGS